MDALTNHYIDIRIDGRVFDRLPANPDAQHRRHHTSGGTSGYTHCDAHAYTRHRRHSIGQDGGHYDRLSCCHSDGNPDIDPNPRIHCNPSTDANSYTHANTDSGPYTHSHSCTNSHPDAYAYPDTSTHAYTNAHGHTTTHPHLHASADTHAYARQGHSVRVRQGSSKRGQSGVRDGVGFRCDRGNPAARGGHRGD